MRGSKRAEDLHERVASRTTMLPATRDRLILFAFHRPTHAAVISQEIFVLDCVLRVVRSIYEPPEPNASGINIRGRYDRPERVEAWEDCAVHPAAYHVGRIRINALMRGDVHPEERERHVAERAVVQMLVDRVSDSRAEFLTSFHRSTRRSADCVACICSQPSQWRAHPNICRITGERHP